MAKSISLMKKSKRSLFDIIPSFVKGVFIFKISSAKVPPKKIFFNDRK